LAVRLFSRDRMLKKPPIETTIARLVKTTRLAKKKNDQKLIQKFIVRYSVSPRTSCGRETGPNRLP
jgi:hypothetical protein